MGNAHYATVRGNPVQSVFSFYIFSLVDGDGNIAISTPSLL